MFNSVNNCRTIQIRKKQQTCSSSSHSHTPHRASVHKGWELLCIVSVTFPPSKDLESYLSDFVEQHHHSIDVKVSVISQHVSSKLVKICKRGAKGKVLTAAEIARAKEAPFKPSVFGESLQLMMEMQAHKDTTLKIPKVVPFLADTVREINGKLSEGIFRIPGDADAVTDLVSSPSPILFEPY